jgi:hypothetical protein
MSPIIEKGLQGQDPMTGCRIGGCTNYGANLKSQTAPSGLQNRYRGGI